MIDGLGAPLDDDGELDDRQTGARRSRRRPMPLARPRISERVGLGVRALDTLVPCGRGQRLGIFAGSGVGKSSLLGMIARSTTADVNVIALVGERGREVREFIERDLGDALEPLGRRRGDLRPAGAGADPRRLHRDRDRRVLPRTRGTHVMLMMDSVTRFAMAQREVGLAIGEPPATRGYTPSVFALLPRLLERAGTSPDGSITGLYTVLVDGDDMNEPIADAVRSILDGHVVLTRALAHAGHYPAIDVLQSVSRLIGEVVDRPVQQAGQRLRAALAAYREKEDLISIGAYQRGNDPLVDSAIALRARDRRVPAPGGRRALDGRAGRRACCWRSPPSSAARDRGAAPRPARTQRTTSPRPAPAGAQSHLSGTLGTCTRRPRADKR